jgi:hypothetical protein
MFLLHFNVFAMKFETKFHDSAPFESREKCTFNFGICNVFDIFYLFNNIGLSIRDCIDNPSFSW